MLYIKNNNFLLSENRNLITFNLTDNSYQKLSLPDVSVENENQDEMQAPADLKNDTKFQGSYSILHTILSPNDKLIAISTKYKEIYVYVIDKNGIKYRMLKKVPRIPSNLTFSPDSKVILVCDKAGDCYKINTEDLESKPQWIFGHLSMILDINFSQDGR